MNKIIQIVSFLILNNLYSQSPASHILNCSSVSGVTKNDCSVFEPHSTDLGYGGFYVNPSIDGDVPVSAIYNVNFNILGISNNRVSGILGNYHLIKDNTKELYGLVGPYELGNNVPERYNKIWSVRKHEIISLIRDFEDNGKIDVTPAINILKWPARGNLNSKILDDIVWPDRDLAPFFDRNKDGIYDPYKGDYPILDPACPEKIPGQMVWSINHGESGNIEIQKLIYAFTSNQDEILNNTIFSRFTVLNLNDLLRDAKFSLYVDFDLGCVNDDFFGTSKDKNTFYAYNKMEKDESPCQTAIFNSNVFKSLTPVQSITFLNQNMSGSIVYDNKKFDQVSGEPFTPAEFYNYFSSSWLNGERITYGDNIYNSNSTQYTNYMFTSNPNDASGWNMVNNPFHSDDPRGFMNMELGNLKKYQSKIVDVAFAYHLPDASIPHYDRVDKMLENIDIVKYWYNSCFKSIEHEDICNEACVWPGDTDNNGIVNNLDLLNIGPYLDTEGSKRALLIDYWDGFSSPSWLTTTPQSLNIKYMDCNGSGKIKPDDFNAVKNNFFSTNSKYSTWGGFNVKGDLLTFGPLSDSLKGGEEFSIDLEFSKNVSTSLFGMGYSIEYDTTFLTLKESLLTSKWIDKKINPAQVSATEKGKIHFGVVKTKGNNSEVSNVLLGRLKFVVRPDFKGDYTTLLKFSNYQKIDMTGKISELTSSDASLVVSNPNDDEEPDLKNTFLLYPNPTIEFVFIRSDKKYKLAELFDVMGRQFNFKVSENSFRVTDLPTGAYIVRLTDEEEGKVMERIVIIK